MRSTFICPVAMHGAHGGPIPSAGWRARPAPQEHLLVVVSAPVARRPLAGSVAPNGDLLVETRPDVGGELGRDGGVDVVHHAEVVRVAVGLVVLLGALDEEVLGQHVHEGAFHPGRHLEDGE